MRLSVGMLKPFFGKTGYRFVKTVFYRLPDYEYVSDLWFEM